MSRASQKYLKKHVVPIKWDEALLPACCQTEAFTTNPVEEDAPVPEPVAVAKAKNLRSKAEKVFPPVDESLGAVQLPKDTAVYQAIKVVRGARQADYGSPEKDFQRTTDMLSAYGFRFEDEHGNIRKLDATDFPIIMICAKLGRQANKHKDDNVIDIIGYADTLDMVVRSRRAEENALVTEDRDA